MDFFRKYNFFFRFFYHTAHVELFYLFILNKVVNLGFCPNFRKKSDEICCSGGSFSPDQIKFLTSFFFVFCYHPNVIVVLSSNLNFFSLVGKFCFVMGIQIMPFYHFCTERPIQPYTVERMLFVF